MGQACAHRRTTARDHLTEQLHLFLDRERVRVGQTVFGVLKNFQPVKKDLK